jgi:presenilin-like A22 family membrane protease
MHKNDLNIKNKVHINTKSYINNWNKLDINIRISHTKSILINVYVYCKNGKKFYNLLCVTIFQAFRHAFFIFVASSLLAKSHILRSVRWPPTEPLTVTHARGHWWTFDFAIAFVSPGVNRRGGISTLARRIAPSALGANYCILRNVFGDTIVWYFSFFVHIVVRIISCAYIA